VWSIVGREEDPGETEATADRISRGKIHAGPCSEVKQGLGLPIQGLHSIIGLDCGQTTAGGCDGGGMYGFDPD
jgi:hypothetical protein